MSQKERASKLSEQDILTAVQMISEGKRLKEVAATFRVPIHSLYRSLRKHGITVALIKKNVLEKKETVIKHPKESTLVQGHQTTENEVQTNKRRTVSRVNPRLAEIMTYLEKGVTLKEAGARIGVTRQGADQILTRSGFTIHDFKPVEPKKDADDLLRKDTELKRKAFIAGLSVPQYLRLSSKIGSKRMSQLSRIERSIENNRGLLKTVPFGTLCQLTVQELFDLYTSAAKKAWPNLAELDAFDKIMQERLHYRLVRKDHNLPFILENVEIISKEEFGERFGIKYGITSPTNPLYKRYSGR